MATQLASIGVGKLSSTARYVDAFIVEIYSDAGYTVKIGQQTSTGQWNGSVWTQKDSIIFGGLVFGTTYYLRAAVIAPVSGALSAWTTFNTAAGSASAPGCTYTGTFTATTSGIGYIVTPATVPTDIDHFEAVWVWDASTPASTTASYWTGQITNSNITFFVGGKPGDTAKVYVRAVNTSQQAQAWQLIDTRAVATTWSGTTIGTIGDGTLLGTGGPSVSSGNTGRLGIGGSQSGDTNEKLLLQGGGFGAHTLAWAMRYSDTTPTTGRSYIINGGGGSGNYQIYDETAALGRTTVNGSGQYGIGGSPTATDVSVFGGSNNGLLLSLPEASVFYNDTTTGSRQYQQYGLSNNFSVWDNTAASNRLILNSSGQYGIGGTPSDIFDAYGVRGAIQGAAAQIRIGDTQVSGVDGNLTSGTTTAGTVYIYRNGSPVQFLSSSGMGIGATPNAPLYLSGDSFVHSGPSATNELLGTNVGGRTFETATGAAHAMLDGQYGWNDVTAGTNRTLLNSSGQYGIGGAPGNIFDIHGGQYATISAGAGGWHTVDTNVSGIGAYFLSGNVAAGNISINRDGTGNVAQWNSVGMGVAGTPANPLDVFGNPHVQASGYDFRSANTQASGRTFGVGSSSAWDGVGYYQMALDHTAATQRLRMDSSGQVGFNQVPANGFDVVGSAVSHGSVAGLYSADRTSGLLHAFYADAGFARINNPTGGDVVTINRSTGNLGIGGTFTGDWISVQGASVLDSNKVVAGGVRGYRYAAGSTATWLKLGTWAFTSSSGGRSVHVDIVTAVGYNTNSAQQAHVELIARSGNSTAAPNISGASYYGRGGSTPVTGFKIVAVGASTSVTNGSWELWVNIAGFTDMIVSPTVDAGDTFTWAGTTGADPGVASSTVVVGTGGMVFNTGGTGMDAVNEGATYGRPLGSRLSSGKPWIDFSEGIHANKNVDNLADGTTYGRTINTYLSSNRPITNFADTFHVNKNQDNIADTVTYQRKRPASPRAVDTPYNSDFEIWTDNLTAGDGWTTAFEVTGSGSTYSRGTGFFGNFGQSIATVVSSGGSVASRPVPVRPNTKYEISARYISNVATTSGFYLRVCWYKDDGSFARGSASASTHPTDDALSNAPTTTSWQFVANTFTSPSDAKYAVLALYNYLPNVNATFTFDSVNIRPADVAQVDVGVDASGNLLFKNLNNASASTSSATQSSNVYAVVPEMSVTITTKGNKVLLNFSGSFSMNATGTPCFFAIFRDGTQISPEFQQTPANVLIFTQACTFIDTGASATSHTFDVRWRTTGGGNTISVAGTNRAFQVVELG